MVEEITAAELRSCLEAGDDVQVVDVRSAEAYRGGHIRGSVNVPLTRFAREVEAHQWGDDIVVVCPHGVSSRQAARLLEAYEGVANDARVANLEDGLRSWDGEFETDH